MRPPPVCRPAVGASAPKGTCRWLSQRGGRAALAALKYNSYRAAGRILCRRLKYATGYCKWQSGLAATIHWDSALRRSDSSLPLLIPLFSVRSSRFDITQCIQDPWPSTWANRPRSLDPKPPSAWQKKKIHQALGKKLTKNMSRGLLRVKVLQSTWKKRWRP